MSWVTLTEQGRASTLPVEDVLDHRPYDPACPCLPRVREFGFTDDEADMLRIVLTFNHNQVGE